MTMITLEGWTSYLSPKLNHVFKNEQGRYGIFISDDLNQGIFIKRNCRLEKVIRELDGFPNPDYDGAMLRQISVYLPDLLTGSQEPRFVIPGQNFSDPCADITTPKHPYYGITNYGIF